MIGPIYFGGIAVKGHTEMDTFHMDKELLNKELEEEWRQEIRSVLKLIDDTKLNMPLVKGVLLTAEPTITIQTFQEEINAT